MQMVLDCATLFDYPWEQFGTDVYYNGGNAGIGTTTPESKLGVVKSTDGTPFIQVKSPTGEGRVRIWGDEQALVNSVRGQVHTHQRPLA